LATPRPATRTGQTPGTFLPRAHSKRWLLILPALILSGLVAPGPQARPALAGACPVISGYVYYDANNNGIMDPGEPPIAGSPIELRDSAGVVVAATSTVADGSYAFANDTSPSVPTLTVSHTAVFPNSTTDWSVTKSVPRFDPALGLLRSVELSTSGTITSAIKAESLDNESATISATVSGTLTLAAPAGRSLATTPSVNAGSFDAAPFDGSSDFAGPSGHDFGAHTASDANSVTISSGAALAEYTGTGMLSFAGSVVASSRTNGGGNVLSQINTTAGAQLSVVYRYAPVTCLHTGSYTIVQSSQPAGYSDGQETSGNLTPIPGSRGADAISVTLSGDDSRNNNFGELRASLSGYVYVDDNNNGIRESGEAPIAGVSVTLGGAESRTTTTNADGYYAFVALTTGTYVITESQPAAYLDGKDAIGSQGGSASNDRFFDINLPVAVNGINNNFGEILPPRPTLTPLPTGTTTSNPPGTPGGPGNPPGNTAGPQPPVITVAGAKTPGAPSTGTGLFGKATSLNVLVVGLIVFSASGWLAFLAVGRHRRDGER
jgi:hypothetical protein